MWDFLILNCIVQLIRKFKFWGDIWKKIVEFLNDPRVSTRKWSSLILNSLKVSQRLTPQMVLLTSHCCKVPLIARWTWGKYGICWVIYEKWYILWIFLLLLNENYQLMLKKQKQRFLVNENIVKMKDKKWNKEKSNLQNNKENSYLPTGKNFRCNTVYTISYVP